MNGGLTQHSSSMSDTASTALAAQAQAAVQARYVVALHKPRKMPDVRQIMLKECRRTSFAEKAKYHKPIGKGVDGPSIRFAEMAVDAMTNILVESPTVYDDERKRIKRVTVMDLEKNNTYSLDVTVSKTVERKNVPEGQTVISQRVNSKGELTYTIPATDDDLLNKEYALVSKAIRNCALRLIPWDLIDECMAVVAEVVKQKIRQDPDAERKRIADGFATININPTYLDKFLGCPLDQATPAQLTELRALYAAMRDGEITPAEAFNFGPDDDKKSKKGLENKLKKKTAEIERKRQEKESAQAATQNQQPETHNQEPPSEYENDPGYGDPSQPTPEEIEEWNRENGKQ